MIPQAPCSCTQDALADSEIRLNQRQMIYYTLAIVLAVTLIAKILFTKSVSA